MSVYKSEEKLAIKSRLKDLKAIGEAPDWMQWFSLAMLEEDYLYKAKTPKERYRQIAKAAADYLPKDNKEWEDKFFNLMWLNWLSVSSPILGNLGTDRGMAVSCSASYVGDSMQDIAYTDYELKMLSSQGFGTAAFLDVRKGGSVISTGGFTNKTRDWVETYWRGQNTVNQGSLRRGSTAIYLDFWQGDLPDVLSMLDTHDKLHLGVVCDDSVKSALQVNDPEAWKVYKLILKYRAKKGKPYIIFIDNAKKQDPIWYKDKGLSTKHSNLCCLTGKTLVVTKEGNKPIKDLVGKTVTIFDGKDWVECSNFELKGKGNVIRVTFEDGTYVDATRDHRWFVLHGDNYTELLTKDLIAEMYLEGDAGDMRVVKVKDQKVDVDVYCANIPTTGKFLLSNGVLTGNSEIFLHTDSEHTLSCVLASMVGARFDEYKDTDAVFDSIVFLDCIAEDLIQRGSKIKGLERVVASTVKSRALGLGLLGFHTYLQQKMISFDSLLAKSYNKVMFKHLQKEAIRATEFLGTWLSEPEWMKGTGRRNSHLIAIAPNTSSAFFSGGYSQGIEPYAGNVFTQKLAKVGNVDRMPAELVKLLKNKSKYNDETINSIAFAKGSVQHLDFLSKEEKDVFKTAFEINQKTLIGLANDRQEYICQGQSLNLFFASDETEERIDDVHRFAFEQDKLKSLYYVRTMAGITADKDDDACLSCSG